MLRGLVPRVLVRVAHARWHLTPGSRWQGGHGGHGGLDVLLHVGRPLRDRGRAGVWRHMRVRRHVTPVSACRGWRRVVVRAMRRREVGGMVARGRAVPRLLPHVRALGAGRGGRACVLHPDRGARGRPAWQRHPGTAHVPRARLHQLLVLRPPVLEPDLHLKQEGAVS